jgi:hypothetical protein
MNGDVAFSLLDLPVSLVADTVILPYTIYEQIKYGDICLDDQIEMKKNH